MESTSRCFHRMAEKYLDTYTNYQQLPQCSRQPQQNVPQPYISYPSVSYSHKTNVLDVYGSNCNRNQSMVNSSFTEQTDTSNWNSRYLPDIEKIIKIPDKIEMIEITSKDLSPVSFTSTNTDFADMYKSNKDTNYYGKFDNLWYYNHNFNQRIYDFPSCAQAATAKYNNDPNIENLETLGKALYCENVAQETKLYKPPEMKSNGSLSTDYSHYTGYDKFQDNVDLYSTSIFPFEPLSTVDQQTEGSNEESDIIVEESEEEVTDYSEDQEKVPVDQINKCVICDTIYTPLGAQFYFLTNDCPLTMSSQKPVITKINDIVKSVLSTRCYICSECLGLINSIDHLQVNLKSLVLELNIKFEKTRSENDTTGTQTEKPVNKLKKPTYIKRFPRYKCKLCKKVLCIKKYFYSHLKNHRKQLLCESCGRVFTSMKIFLIHSKRHKKNENVAFSSTTHLESFKCSNCEKLFRTKSNLKDHQNNCLGILPYECRYCDKRFPTTTKLKNHVKLKHDKKFIAICSICNIGFIKVSDYKSHMMTHSTDKKFGCTKCDKTYKSLSNLNFHMKVHDEKQQLICQICGKGFIRKEYLEAHINNHMGVKNYACTICDKRFVSQKNLDSHLKYHDGTVPKKTCTVCGRSMSTGFEEHMRIHNNLREFECPNCDMKFNTKGTLRKHIAKKHQDNG